MESPSVGYGSNGRILLDKTIFYPISRGQLNDLGTLSWKGKNVLVSDVRIYGMDGIKIVLEENLPLSGEGNETRKTCGAIAGPVAVGSWQNRKRGDVLSHRKRDKNWPADNYGW